MQSSIKQISPNEAALVSKWTYEKPYSNYSMDESEECINELLNGFYFSVTDSKNDILGYYCFGESAQVPAGRQFGCYSCKDFLDIGLGLNPDLCGRGNGYEFLCDGIKFARDHFSADKYRLTVAAFNKRAIKVYERAGFVKVDSFQRVLESGGMEFWVMTLSCNS